MHTLTAWKNGGKRAKTVTYGLRIGRRQRDQLVEDLPTVTLTLQGGPTLDISLTDAFWRKCPEFRHAAIEAWFTSQDLRLPWPDGEPYQFAFTREAPNVFRVQRTAQA